MKNVIAIYSRISTADQEAKNQLLELEKFCQKNDWKIYDRYVDIASGGKTKDERRELKRLFDDASKRKFDLVLFWSLDRFSREGVLPTLNYLNQLNSYGVGFKSYTEQYLDSTGIFKEAIISILAAIARQEKIRIGERTKSGLRRAKAQGKILGRPKVAVNISEIVRLKKNGKSYRDISKELGISVGKISEVLTVH